MTIYKKTNQDIFILVVLMILFVPSIGLSGTRTEIYLGKATNELGQLVYTEEHHAQFNHLDEAVSSKTTYKNSKGEVIGILESDFSKSVTVPSYNYKDLRHGESHGIRFLNDEFILFKKDKVGVEKTKAIKNEPPKNGLIVGCQGLHYYLRKNLERIKNQGVVKIKFLTPGSLDYYNFRMKFLKEENNIASLRIDINNFFLRLFAPSLKIKYDKKLGRLLEFKGLSNISDDKGDMQNVLIKYDYSGQ